MAWSILYEDEWIAAVDKPSGLLVTPDRWDKELVNLVDWVQENHSPDWRNVHRLDRDTSGIVLFAKDSESLAAFTALFETREVVKSYSAIVRPAPRQTSGVIDRPLDADPRRPGRMRIAVSGKPSRTEWELVEAWRSGAVALIDVHPLTGRTHQIRVHLAAIGAPVVGDAWYGDGLPLRLSDVKRRFRGVDDGPPLLDRLALHAHSLEFTHPVTGAACRIESPWPSDFQRAIERLQRA
jgi:RluA family pseudouridine synthase